MATTSSEADLREPESEPAPQAGSESERLDTRPPDEDQPPAAKQPRHKRWFRYKLPGAWVALIFVCLSFTPSLVPRPGAFSGIVCGITGAIGYGLGVLGARLWREFADRPARPTRPRSWRVFWIAGAVLLAASYLAGQRWQGQIRDLMDAASESFQSRLLWPVFAIPVFVGLVAAGRGVRGVFRWTSHLLDRWIGERAARAVGWLLAAALAIGLVTGVIVDGIIAITNQAFSVRDTTTSDTAVQPTTGLRSGGPGSLVPWDTLGYQGRNFTGMGPTGADIAVFTGSAAPDPIRAYAGIASAEDVEERARLAVADLQRAGGFDRQYLLVAGTTGTGWVEPAAISSFEYETGGDSAAVGIQYSYLPSWASFIVDQEKARAAGRALFDEVYRAWSELPPDGRPQLYVFGLSLGSFSMETPFGSDTDMANRTAGGLLAGPPAFNPLHREFADGRDAGTPEVQPVFRDGRIVRFTNNGTVAAPPVDQPWSGSRILYLQHASDPVVWLSPDLILNRPDWLAEPAGPDVIDEMFWIPFVTFWQVAADLLEPVDTPSGHGHSYTDEFVDGWATVLQPPGWNAEKAEALQAILAEQTTG